MPKIICPICDEELGNCIDDVPEKCPICDTRKHEILVELKGKDASLGINEIPISKQPVSSSFAEEFNHPIVVEEETVSKDSSEENNEEIIFTDVPLVESKPWEVDSHHTENEEIQYISENFGESETSLVGNTSDSFIEVEAKDNLYAEQEGIPQYIPPTPIDEAKPQLPLLRSTEESNSKNKSDNIPSLNKPLPMVAPTLRPSESITRHLAKALEDEEATESSENSSAPILKPKRELSNVPSKSGASCLERLPGYQRCSKCQATYPKDYKQDCICGNSTLETVDKKFAPGDYIILYNSNKKAIAYFMLDKQGSIFIGRSSERGSDRDIDLSIAWKHFYYRNATSEEDFKDKMRLLKGISRKHALIRFDKEVGKYILFHLSDKNYTVAELASGEKRTRAPQNRNRIDLDSDTILSMGNQKDFIIMRYRKITA